MNKKPVKDYIKSSDRVPQHESIPDCRVDALICACIFGIVGMMVGWVACMLIMGVT